MTLNVIMNTPGNPRSSCSAAPRKRSFPQRALVFLFLALLPACNGSPEAAFRAACKQDTVEVYQTFIRDYSNRVSDADATSLISEASKRMRAKQAQSLPSFTGVLTAAMPMDKTWAMNFTTGTINTALSQPIPLFVRAQDGVEYLVKFTTNAQLVNIAVSEDQMRVALGLTYTIKGKSDTNRTPPRLLAEYIMAPPAATNRQGTMGAASGDGMRRRGDW